MLGGEGVYIHGAGAGSNGKHAVRISAVVSNRVFDHVRYRLAVTTTVVFQGYSRIRQYTFFLRDIPKWFYRRH
jgi:hypothetical protein